MNGNPHAESVNKGIQNIRDLIGRRELYQRDGMGIILEAQSRMAVAHEVRTLALVNLLGNVPLDDVKYTQLLLDIQNRIGHGAE